MLYGLGISFEHPTSLKTDVSAKGLDPLPPELDNSNVTISGSPTPSKTLTANNGRWLNAESFTYQWFADGVEIDGETGKTYLVVIDDVGADISVEVTASNVYGSTTETSGSVTVVAGTAPKNITLPALAGVPSVGNPIASSGGTWYDGGSAIAITYQWMRNGTDIPGATASTYTPTVDDKLAINLAKVTATNATGATTSITRERGKTLGAAEAPINLRLPVVGGAMQVGSTAQVSNGDWNFNVATFTYRYRWFADGVELNGERSQSIVITEAHLGKRLSAEVTARNFLGQAAAMSLRGNTVAPEDGPVVEEEPYTVTEPGGAIVVEPGVYDGAGDPEEVEYEWYEDGVLVPDENTDTYTPSGPGVVVTVVVTVPSSNPEGPSTVITINPGESGESQPDGRPVLKKVAQLSPIENVGDIATLYPGGWDGQGSTVTITYEWFFVGDNTPFADEGDGLSYETQPGDEWKFIQVVVTATNSEGSTEYTTGPSFMIRPAKTIPYPVEFPKLAGVATVGNTISAIPGEWYDGDYGFSTPGGVSFTYEWFKDGVTTSVTDGFYEIQPEDVGSTFYAEVVGSNEAGSSAPVKTPSSAEVEVAAEKATNTVAPVLSGTAELGETLTVTDGTWDDNGSTITEYRYAWMWNTTPIPDSGSENTYTIRNVDANKKIRALVFADNAGGTASVYSNQTDTVPDEGPTNAELPVITGFTVAGQTLFATQGAWSVPGSPITGYVYQWLADGIAIEDANSTSYVLTAEDIGSEISVRVTALHPLGDVDATSDPTAEIDASFLPPVNDIAPVVTGEAKVGVTLSCSTGTWTTNGYEITSYEYQWRRSGSPISGADGDDYTLVELDEGEMVDCVVTAYNDAGDTSEPSNSVGPVEPDMDADAAAFIAAMTSTPDSTRQEVINNFVVALKSAGLWAKLDVIHLFAAHDAQAARVNLKNPAQVGTVSGSTFTANSGYAGNGSNGVLDTGINVSGLSNFSRNSCSLGAWFIANPTVAGAFIGAGAFYNRIYRTPSPTNNMLASLSRNDEQIVATSVVNPLGFIVSSRTTSALHHLYKNASSIGNTTTPTNQDPPSSNCRYFSDGSTFSNGRLGFGFYGGGLSGSEVTALQGIVSTYLTAVGAI